MTTCGRLSRNSSILLDLSGRKWVVSSKPLTLCPQYPLDRRLDGPQSWCGSCGEDINLGPAESRTPPTQLITHHYTN
jgi:hypothetical protein